MAETTSIDGTTNAKTTQSALRDLHISFDAPRCWPDNPPGLQRSLERVPRHLDPAFQSEVMRAEHHPKGAVRTGIEFEACS